MKTFSPTWLGLISVLALSHCATAPASPTPATPTEPVIAAPPPSAAAPAAFASVNPNEPVPLKVPAPLQTVVQPIPNRPVVSFRLVFRAGSIDDPKGKEGLTDFTATLLAQGGTRSLSSSQLLDALFPIAAELSAQTDKELTAFVARVHQDNLETFLPILTDVLLEPRFDPAEFNRLKNDALNVIKNTLRNENDEALGKIALDALLYANHPYRHFVGGTVKGLESITLDDVKAHWKKVFTQDRLVVGLAGAVTPELEKRLKDRLAQGLPATGTQRANLPPPPNPRGQAVILQKQTLSTAVSMGYSWRLRRGDPDFFPVALALSLLGEHRQFHGILFKQLREARGLNYGDYAYAEHFVQEGGSTYAVLNIPRSEQDMTIWIRPVEPQNAVFATRGVLYYVHQLLKQGVTAEDFEVARGFLTGYTRLWEATDQRRLGYAIDSLFYGTPNFLEEYRKALGTMTPEQVNAAIRRHITLDRFNFAFVTQDAKALAEALHHQKPSPLQYASPKEPAVLEVDKAISTFPLPLSPDSLQILPATRFMEE
jgi:zinc protease